jgi:SpoVK/Ycf46/Vps4 family AAA+-type ATPase
MAYFLKSGNTFNVTNKEAMDLHDKLPAGNYVIKKNEMTGALYLEQIESFEIKGKVYGDTLRNADRILNTFHDRTASTGVMLNGEKGSGKTLLAKMLAVKSAEAGVPTIVINAPWSGDKFNAFLQMIDQPCVVLFDEFEKVYPSEEQEAILTLLDGVFPSKKLFVLTCNDKWRVDSHMRNRPGRIFYMMDFKGLENDFIIEYCEDNLKAKEHIQKICSIASLFGQFNFDMLKALVEEMNRYNETPEQALKMLNAKPEFDGGNVYSIQLDVAGQVLDEKLLEDKNWKGNPLQSAINVDYKSVEEAKADDDDSVELDWEWERAKFTNADIKKIDSANGKFVFLNKDGARLVLTKVKEKNYNYFDAF